MIFPHSNGLYPSIRFGILHIEDENCGERHRLRDKLVENIGDRWRNLNVVTASFDSLTEAEKFGEAQCEFHHFRHVVQCGK